MFRIYSKINLLFAFLLCIGSYSSLYSQCNGNVTLTTQQQVYDLWCTQVNGNLTISGPNIISLDTLFGQGLNSVTGNLIVTNCPNLTSLQGLDGIQSVVGNFEIVNTGITSLGNFAFQLTNAANFKIINNDALENLNLNNGSPAFPFLSNVGGGFEVSLNNSLTSVTGFSSLTTINFSLNISGNNNLSIISGFGSLNVVNGNFSLENNPNLIDVSGFQDINQINDINIFNNTLLSLCCFAEYLLNNLFSEKDNLPLFSVDNRGESLFVELVYPQNITKNFSIISKSGKLPFDFFEFVSFLAIKNGEHDGVGYMVDTDKHYNVDNQDYQPVTNLFERMLSHFGIPVSVNKGKHSVI